MAVVAEMVGTLRVCVGCGEEFEDRGRSAPRSYCYSCRPGAVVAQPGRSRKPVRGKPFTVEHFRAWSGRFKLKDGRRFKLEPYQALFLEDLFARDGEGKTVYCELWLVVPEGNGKTTFFALVTLYVLAFVPEAWVPVAASARDQAVDLTYRIAAGFVKRNDLEDAYRLHPGYRQIVHRESGGVAKIFASDAASGDGVDPTLALIEELHRLTDMSLYETWAGKVDKSDGQLIVASTAGEPGSAFEELRERIRQAATDSHRDGCFLRAASGGVVLHEYAIPEDGDPEDLELVAQANPFSAKTVEQLAKKRTKPSWSLAHWQRFTCNLPTRGASAAITEREWAAARSDRLIPAGERVWAGLDLGWKLDTTALVPLWWESDHFRLFGPAVVLEPPRNGDMLAVDDVKGAIMQLDARNPIVSLVMDMTDGADIAQWASDELGLVVVDRSQGNPALVGDYSAFMAGLRGHVLFHSGDRGLTDHALNATARVLPNGDVRFARPKQARLRSDLGQRARVFDALQAAAMVHSVAATPAPAEMAFAWGPA